MGEHMSEDPTFAVASDDDAMNAAMARARQTFRFCWREVAWDHQRIVPALEMSGVKLAFTTEDRPVGAGLFRILREAFGSDPEPTVEHMWIVPVAFDGASVMGELLNDPVDLPRFKAGDKVLLPVDRMSDWMYVLGGRVYGGHTIQLMRERMSAEERAAHDDAWDLPFEDTVALTPHLDADGIPLPHPAEEAFAASFRDHVRANPGGVDARLPDGWTMLHHQAVNGNEALVDILLEEGADPRATTPDGLGVADLARRAGWVELADHLATR